MEKNYNITQYDYFNYYYFIDDNGCFEVSKTISLDEYNYLCKEYYQKTKSWLFSYLFENGELKSKLSILKFIALDMGESDYATKQKVVELFTELMGNVEILELKGKIIIFYFENLDLSFKDIINAINNDFYTSIKIYESGKLNTRKPQDFRNLFEIVLKFLYSISFSYVNNSVLILELASINTKEIKNLKPIILYKVNQDSQFEKLVNSLYDNNLNVSKTAKDIFMHRNTINNKLDMITKETGLNIQNFYDALAMYILLNAK